jgi:hypothetical protein
MPPLSQTNLFYFLSLSVFQCSSQAGLPVIWHSYLKVIVLLITLKFMSKQAIIIPRSVRWDGAKVPDL